MGKFTTRAYNPNVSSPVDFADDIHCQLSRGKLVLLIYKEPQISLKSAKTLLKKILLDDVYKVTITQNDDIEHRKRMNPDKEIYPILVDEMINYLNNPSIFRPAI